MTDQSEPPVRTSRAAPSFDVLETPVEFRPAGVLWTAQEYDRWRDVFRCQVVNGKGEYDLTDVPGDVVRSYNPRRARRIMTPRQQGCPLKTCADPTACGAAKRCMSRCTCKPTSYTTSFPVTHQQGCPFWQIPKGWVRVP